MRRILGSFTAIGLAAVLLASPVGSALAGILQQSACNGLPATIDRSGSGTGGGTITGTGGNDVIVGSPGPDTINAGNGNDTVCSGGGNDRVDGGAGNDTLRSGGGPDLLRGGLGVDVADY